MVVGGGVERERWQHRHDDVVKGAVTEGTVDVAWHQLVYTMSIICMQTILHHHYYYYYYSSHTQRTCYILYVW